MVIRGIAMRRHNRFWTGFAAGAASGVGAMLGWNALAAARNSRVLRLERSLQIGKPVNQVFAAWTELEQLPALSDTIRSIETHGRRSRWVVTLDGKKFEWEAEVTQFIPNQAIGWKSIRGPKHTGRVTFARIGADTLVHVTMNYAPPLGIFSRTIAPLSGHLQDQVDRALREFKAALEARPREEQPGSVIATGTFGGPAARLPQTEEQTRPVPPAPFAQPDAKR
jgi:uncharacterized membrane protein